jgi:hypothetical protein
MRSLSLNVELKSFEEIEDQGDGEDFAAAAE